MLNERNLELDFILQATIFCCWDEIRVEAVWLMTRRGRTKYVLVLIWSRELCELCSAQRGRRQSTTSEAIIWRWDHCLALSLCGCMAHRGLAKQHNWLCYLISAFVSLCKDIFQSLAVGHSVRQLDLSSGHLLSNHQWDSFQTWQQIHMSVSKMGL